MQFTSLFFTLAAFTTILAAPTSDPSKVDEISNVFSASLNNNFIPPSECKLINQALPERYSCTTPNAPLYMNWREFQAAEQQLRSSFTGRLGFYSWTVENRFKGFEAQGDADYWTIEFGDACLRKGMKPSGKKCLVIKVTNAWE